MRGAITGSHPGGRRQRSAAWGHKLADVEFVQLRAAEARTEWTVDCGLEALRVEVGVLVLVLVLGPPGQENER